MKKLSIILAFIMIISNPIVQCSERNSFLLTVIKLSITIGGLYGIGTYYWYKNNSSCDNTVSSQSSHGEQIQSINNNDNAPKNDPDQTHPESKESFLSQEENKEHNNSLAEAEEIAAKKAQKLAAVLKKDANIDNATEKNSTPIEDKPSLKERLCNSCGQIIDLFEKTLGILPG